MKNFKLNNVEFEDINFNELIKNLNQCFYNKQINFAKLSFTIYSIVNYAGDNTYKNITTGQYYTSTTLLEAFGFDKSSITKYKHSFEKFCQGTSIENVFVKTFFINFSPSKLFELLQLSNETLENAINKKLITPEMTVKKIREFVKSLKDGNCDCDNVIEDMKNINEEEIPMAFDSKQEYEYSYFETKTKSQLLNIAWELYKECQKLRKDKKNEKTK